MRRYSKFLFMPHSLKLLYQVWCCVLPIELKVPRCYQDAAISIVEYWFAVQGSDTTMLNKDKMPAPKITNIP